MKSKPQNPYWYMDNTEGKRKEYPDFNKAHENAAKEPGMFVVIHTPESMLKVKASGSVTHYPLNRPQL